VADHLSDTEILEEIAGTGLRHQAKPFAREILASPGARAGFRSSFLFEHVLFGKPESTHRIKVRGHAFPGIAPERASYPNGADAQAFTPL
jgi:hypothetical protein